MNVMSGSPLGMIILLVFVVRVEKGGGGSKMSSSGEIKLLYFG